MHHRPDPIVPSRDHRLRARPSAEPEPGPVAHAPSFGRLTSEREGNLTRACWHEPRPPVLSAKSRTRHSPPVVALSAEQPTSLPRAPMLVASVVSHKSLVFGCSKNAPGQGVMTEHTRSGL